jgi:serine kinase of HPr protein (carbohydrate metabolism regulator)
LRENDPGTTKQKRLVITGIEGIGKSELCLQVASLARKLSHDDKLDFGHTLKHEDKIQARDHV